MEMTVFTSTHFRMAGLTISSHLENELQLISQSSCRETRVGGGEEPSMPNTVWKTEHFLEVYMGTTLLYECMSEN